MTSRIPKGEFNVLAINLDIGDIVLEDGGDVDLYKCRVSLGLHEYGMGRGKSVGSNQVIGRHDGS